MSLTELLRSSYARRAELHGRADQTVYRLFHGYGEGQPGLVIDRFDRHALITHKHELTEELQPLADTLLELYPFTSVIAKAHRYFNWNSRPLSVTPLHGELPEQPEIVVDNGLRFATTLNTLDSVGLFLDSRPARQWLLNNSEGRKVLNLFAYTGSLGIAALKGGAKSVVHVDSKPTPLEVARANHTLNDLPNDARSFMVGNVYKHLPKARKSKVTFDGIILDPPPRVPDRLANRPPEGQDYPQLTPLAARLLNPGGWLLCFFSRFEKGRQAFEQEVLENAGIDLEIIWRGESGIDFPEEDAERKLRITAFRR